MTKSPLALILSFFVLSVLAGGCYYDVEEELYPPIIGCDTANVTFSLDVEPVLSSNCYVCHSAGAAQGGVVLDDYTSVKGFADSGSLLGAVRHDAGYSAMPQGGSKLSTCTIAAIEKWVSDGAPNN